jgi:hypothetical protein
MDIKRVGTQPSAKGPAEWFTGTVGIDPLFQLCLTLRADRRQQTAPLIGLTFGATLRIASNRYQ